MRPINNIVQLGIAPDYRAKWTDICHTLRLGCLFLCVVLTGCAHDVPDSSSHSQPDRLNGLWIGQFDINGRGPFDFAAVHVDGRSYAYSLHAKTICVGVVELQDQRYEAHYRLFAMDGGPFDEATILGDLSAQNMIESQFVTHTGGDSGSLDLMPTSLHLQSTSVEQLAGVWGFVDRDGLAIEASFDQQGGFFGSDSDGCVYAGEVMPVDAASNLYEIRVSIGQCASVTGNYDGMGFFDGDGDRLDHFKMTVTGEHYGFYFDFQQGSSSEYKPLFKDSRRL